MMSLELRDVSLRLQRNRFGAGEAKDEEEILVRSFSLKIAVGEIVTLMGASGVGKSSLLSGIAGGLKPPFAIAGQVLLNGRDVTPLAAEARRIGRLFQDDLLFPHMTVGENLLFGIAKGNADQRRAKMRQALSDIELEGFENRPPHTLSGGQRQRVALMRSLLAEPEAMLLDEPFSKLDRDLRSAIRDFTFDVLGKRGTPTLLVTHDLADAPLGGRLLKIENGEVLDA